MIKYTIYADYHAGHPFGIRPNFSFGKNVVFLGDNFDLRNTLNTELGKIISMRNETIKRCDKSGGIYVAGNHSLESIKNIARYCKKRGSTLFIHGDTIDYGMMGARAYRTFFSPGKGKIYWYILKYWRKIFPGDDSKLTKRQINTAVDIAREWKCKTIVMGHFHPRKMIDIDERGVRIIVVPRGRTIIYL